jgi:hypothetical protein
MGGGDHLHNLRDHIAGPLNNYGVADPDILAINLILVVQGGPADHDAADLNGFHDGDRRQDTCAAHLDDDRLDNRLLADGGKQDHRL